MDKTIDPERGSESKLTRAEFLGCVYNVTKNGLGANVMFAGAGFATGGVLVGTLALALIGAMQALTFYYIGHASFATGKSTYHEIIELLFSTRTSKFATICNFVTTFAILVIYMMAMGQFAYVFFQEYVFQIENEKLGIVTSQLIVGFLVAVPMSFFPDIAHFRYGSLVGIIVMLYIALLHFFAAVLGKNMPGVEYTLASPPQADLVSSFGFLAIFGQAFSCHFNAPSYYKQSNESEKEYKKVTIVSFTMMFLVNLTIAFFSFVNFGYNLAKDAPNILYFVVPSLTKTNEGVSYPELYPEMKHAGVVALFAMAINLAIGFGIVLHPTRIALNNFHRFLYGSEIKNDISYLKHVVLTVLICACVMALATLLVFVDGFDALAKAVNFITSTFCVIISVTFPALMFLALKKRNNKQKILPVLTIILGLAISVAGLMKFGKSLQK